MDTPPGAGHAPWCVPTGGGGPGPPAFFRWVRERPCGDVPARQPGSADRGEEAARGAIDGEASVLPGRVLTQSREPLHVAPHRTGIRLELLRQRVRLSGMLLRQIQSLHSRVENRLARGTELLGDSPQDDGAVESGIGIETGADVRDRRGPRLLNGCPHVPAPEASHML